MAVTINLNPMPITLDSMPERADEIRLAHLFNTKYNQGIESDRRSQLLALLREAQPLFERIVMEAKAISDGERERYDKAVDRLMLDEAVPPFDGLLFDNIDPLTQSIWDCCEALTWEAGHECPKCGARIQPASCLDDDAATVQELITLLETAGTKENTDRKD